MGGPGPGPVLNERQLTSAIKNATNADRLLQLACSHSGSINAIHVAAILTKLANITKAQPNQQHQCGPGQQVPHGSASAAFGGPGAAGSNSSNWQEAHEALVTQLQALLKAQRCHGHCPRGLANIIWALGKMHDAPDAELMLMLLRRFFGQLASAVPQDIANVQQLATVFVSNINESLPSHIHKRQQQRLHGAIAADAAVQQGQQQQQQLLHAAGAHGQRLGEFGEQPAARRGSEPGQEQLRPDAIRQLSCCTFRGLLTEGVADPCMVASGQAPGILCLNRYATRHSVFRCILELAIMMGTRRVRAAGEVAGISHSHQQPQSSLDQSWLLHGHVVDSLQSTQLEC
ncbi:hypothetical protein COO60DRAFT_1461735 [Scenedesmus sp. NREL 46B-D3]|nr:hypothetical protein COO60DRAFT_1461735 [Scenedesmus sp. NREL 46B-D3]